MDRLYFLAMSVPLYAHISGLFCCVDLVEASADGHMGASEGKSLVGAHYSLATGHFSGLWVVFFAHPAMRTVATKMLVLQREVRR